MKINLGHFEKIRPLILNSPLTFVSGSVRCCSASACLTRGILTSFRFGGLPGGVILTPPCRFFICGRILMILFSEYSASRLLSKTYLIFFYDHYDVRYGHFSTSGVSKNHVFSSFWLTAFLLDFCPTLFWSKIDA